jgi:Cu-Zn family superoxide dismutase
MPRRALLTLSPVLAGLALVGGLSLVACSTSPAEAKDPPAGQHHEHGEMFTGVTEAVAVVIPTEGSKVRGVVRFTQTDEHQVRVVADLTGLQPGGTHGFHIHEFGDLTAPDGSSLGGHYNPEGHPHAGPAADQRHAGDLGNVVADAEGKARHELTVRGVTVAGTKNPIIGRGVVVHAQPDDLKSQPTGAAGARIGVGAIGIAQTKK